MPSPRTNPSSTTLFPADHDQRLPGPQRGPTAALTASIVGVAWLMLLGSLLLG
jgi:hypothetical protein